VKSVPEKLREAADALEQAGGTVLMPGWDDSEPAEEKAHAVRFAARAIAGDDRNPDEGILVPARKLGGLIRYIADMMEA